ncbi:MAG: tachylectin-related carbohydrate-binding protein, partial [Trichodesmium sp. St17_bin3_1_1]|nr:tachylectin-related carbohydrate-binding protein [Trichodesmium sp. St17_bin3_1_1]
MKIIQSPIAKVLLASIIAILTIFTSVVNSQGTSGILFAQKPNGELSYYSYSGSPNLNNFNNNGSERVISSGWNIYSKIFSGGSGILFAQKPNGELSYYSYSGSPNLNNFNNNGSERVISSGWNIYSKI